MDKTRQEPNSEAHCALHRPTPFLAYAVILLSSDRLVEMSDKEVMELVRVVAENYPGEAEPV